MSYTPLEVCLRISKAGLTSPDWLPLLVVDLPFQEYVEQLLHPQDPASLGNGEPDPGSSGSGTLGSPLLPELLPVPLSAGRHPVLFWRQQLHRVGTPLPALLSASISSLGNHPCL